MPTYLHFRLSRIAKNVAAGRFPRLLYESSGWVGGSYLGGGYTAYIASGGVRVPAAVGPCGVAIHVLVCAGLLCTADVSLAPTATLTVLEAMQAARIAVGPA